MSDYPRVVSCTKILRRYSGKGIEYEVELSCGHRYTDTEPASVGLRVFCSQCAKAASVTFVIRSG